MTQPRTLNLLNEVIQDDYKWRITELSNFKTTVISTNNPKAQTAMLRAGVTLLYAHWEGFVKKTADTYYKHVSYQKCTIEDLNNSFRSIILRGEIEKLTGTKKLKQHNILMEIWFEKQKTVANFSESSPVRTANLKYDIFEDVCILIGIDIDEFRLKYLDKGRFDRDIQKTIDNDLVDRRNAIAHGEYLPIKIEEYKLLYDFVVNGMLYTFKESVIDAAQNKKYLKKY
jgi:MAE_28990/MAE_18760-like HEPN